MTEQESNTECRENSLSYWAVLGVIVWLLALTVSLRFNQQYSEWLGVAGLGLMASFVLATFRGNLQWNVCLVVLWSFWLWWLVAFWFSPVSYVSETTLWSMVALPVSATTTYWMVRRQPQAWSVFYHGLVALCMLLALYGCYQYFIEWQPARGTFINKNNFAGFLMMVLLVSMGRYILDQSGQNSRLYLGSILFFMLIVSFVIGAISSLGATLALGSGMVFIFLTCRIFLTSRRGVWTALGVVILGLVLANILGTGALGEKISSMTSPFEIKSGQERFSIWSSSVEIAKEALPLGIGPGLFWLIYPRFRLPADESGSGFYVHNDYLQFLIEAGPAALLTFLLFTAVLTYQVFRFSRRPGADPKRKVEALILFAALSALAGHSLLTFNLYIVPILMVAGAIVGRLFVLLETDDSQVSSGSSSDISRWPMNCTRGFSLLIIFFSVIFYFKAIGGGFSFNEAMRLAAEKNWQESASQYQQAIGFWDEVDVYHYSYAWALFEIERAQSEQLQVADFSRAMKHLDIAEALNPYRPQPHFLRARISQFIGLRNNNGSPELESVSDGYRRALELDPLYLDARFRLARLLLQQNEIEQGLKVLEEGLIWRYSHSVLKQQYYRLTAEILKIVGDQGAHLELLGRSQSVAEALQRKAVNEHKKQSLFQWMCSLWSVFCTR